MNAVIWLANNNLTTSLFIVYNLHKMVNKGELCPRTENIKGNLASNFVMGLCSVERVISELFVCVIKSVYSNSIQQRMKIIIS